MHILLNMLWEILSSRRENSMKLSGNYIFTRPGEKCFEISSNFTNYIELGIQGITKYYLEAKIEGNEFKISGTLLDKKGIVICILEENSVKDSCNKEIVNDGYRIKDKDKNPILEIKINNNICHLKGVIYGESGEIIAQDKEGYFMVLKGPLTIGKSGEFIGIYIGKEEVLRQSEASQNIIKVHDNDLKVLLHQWKQYLPKIVRSESSFNCYDDYGFVWGPPLSEHTHPSMDMLFSIENHILFKDMIYHLISVNNVLSDKWNDFKERIIKYDNNRYGLYKKIKTKYEQGMFIPMAIFTAAISLAKKNKSLNTIYEYNYNSNDRILYYKAISDYYILAENINESESDEKIIDYENISREYYEKYKDIINGIVDNEMYLKNARKELLKGIDDLILFPLLPFNMNCSYCTLG